MVALYSESLEVLQSVLQIDHTLTKNRVDAGATSLGLLCGRIQFPSFHEMVSCLIEVDGTVSVIFDGMVQSMFQYRNSLYQDVSRGCKGDKTWILLSQVLNANIDITKHEEDFIFHWTCSCLRGELSIVRLSLFLSKDDLGIKVTDRPNGRLPIHFAAERSSSDVLNFLSRHTQSRI
jgi:hypothetical protein